MNNVVELLSGEIILDRIADEYIAEQLLEVHTGTAVEEL